jgi:DNA-binding NarL/FixJ family response regulator
MIKEKHTERSTPSSIRGRVVPEPNRPFEAIRMGDSDEGLLVDPTEARSSTTAYKPSLSNPTLLVAVVDKHSFTRGCISKWLTDHDSNIKIISFASAEDCLQNASAPDLILYYAHETADHTNDMRVAPVDMQLSPVKKLLEIAPVVILAAADNSELLIEAFESGVRGYIPTVSTSVELLVEIIHLVRAGGVFVPPSSLNLHRSKRKNLTANTAFNAPMNHQFTPRQIAVLNQLTQGKANKIIAYELSMSESTVKVHIRNIMKKMNASNRTEVACRARDFSDVIYTTINSNMD